MLRGVERTGSSSFAVQLREARERAALTQEELAERAGLTCHAVSALERGHRTRPYPHTQRALADALGLDEQARAALFAAVPRRTERPPVVRALPAPAAPVEDLLRVLLEESRAAADTALRAAQTAEARHRRLEAALVDLLEAAAVPA